MLQTLIFYLLIKHVLHCIRAIVILNDWSYTIYSKTVVYWYVFQVNKTYLKLKRFGDFYYMASSEMVLTLTDT